ncbi:ABC transporter ATP-binding protein [Natronobeatus ordinarius]|uniref:ABC transporter ATP-binding protein n=1 Tax=Natronobeatus ordinarius TaxID=2963433 RepID=UPI0020CEF8FC|nr:oligopeptide/dipeptide ABC transporter ATP-binding protein [Natronobeatus ordinarius]
MTDHTTDARTVEDADETDDAGGEEPLLSVENLETHYPITKGWLRREMGRIRAVDGVTFSVGRGEAVGLVGESGSGKSTTAESILRLVEPTSGEIYFDGERVTALEGRDLRAFRRRAQLVVQDPNEAFSPRMTVGEAVAEPLRLHGMGDGSRRRRIVEDLLKRVGLSAGDADRYPHEFSGGEKQRIAIARALVLNPDLIVADEPTSALDTRVESDVLALLDDVRREYDISILFISHDIDVVRRFCDRVVVMYLGKTVERGPVESVLGSPAHPYTQVLLESVPSLDPTDRTLARPLTDVVPDPADPPAGCRFHTRCPAIIPPAEVDVDDGWKRVAAFRFTLEAGELPGTLTCEGATDASSVRDAFDLPETFPDETVDEAVTEAVAALADGDRKRATDGLSDAFRTICERREPEERTVDGQQVRCHRYNPDAPCGPVSPSTDR